MPVPFDYWFLELARELHQIPNELEERISGEWLLKIMEIEKLRASVKVHHD